MIPGEVLQAFTNMRVVVTGGTGLIGRQVVDILCDAGARVKVITLDALRLHPRAEYVVGDLSEFSFCREAFRDADYVCHIAGVAASMDVAATHLASHFVPTLMMNTNVLEACRTCGVRKVVYTSSYGAYAPAEVFRESDYRVDSMPGDFASWAKRMGELQVHAYKVQYGLENFAVVRPSNVYGPGDMFSPKGSRVIGSLMYRILHGDDPVVVWGDGTAVRDFVFSRDVAQGILLALHYGTRGGFVNLGGVAVSIRDLVETLRRFLDFRYELDASKPGGSPRKVVDNSLAREWLGYEPRTSLEEGLRLTWEWYSAHPEEYLMKRDTFRAG